MVDADLAAGLRLSRACGWNQTLDDWRLLLSLGPGLFRVAERDGEVVASAGAVCHGDTLAWVCMVLVLPGERGRGLGGALFDDVLERVDERVRRGTLGSVGLDATPEGHGLYRKRGFSDGPRLERLQLTDRLVPRPAEVRPLVAADFEGVLALDRRAFGADRAPALRHAFAAAPGLAWIAAGGAAGGYCFGRHGDHSDHVGPLAASDLERAAALVAACASVDAGRPLIIDAFARPAWIRALAALGFRTQRPFTRMYRGPAPAGREPQRLLAAFGPELG